MAKLKTHTRFRKGGKAHSKTIAKGKKGGKNKKKVKKGSDWHDSWGAPEAELMQAEHEAAVKRERNAARKGKMTDDDDRGANDVEMVDDQHVQQPEEESSDESEVETMTAYEKLMQSMTTTNTKGKFAALLARRQREAEGKDEEDDDQEVMDQDEDVDDAEDDINLLKTATEEELRELEAAAEADGFLQSGDEEEEEEEGGSDSEGGQGEDDDDEGGSDKKEEEEEEEEDEGFEVVEFEELDDKDEFRKQFQREITEKQITEAKEMKFKFKKVVENGEYSSHTELPDEQESVHGMRVKDRVIPQWEKLAKKTFHKKGGKFTKLQQQLFPLLDSYKDIMFPDESFDNLNEIRTLYCLHAMNHTLKVRDLVLKNTARIKAQKEGEETTNIQDSGFTRPKVLILVPFKNAAAEIVETLIKLSPSAQHERIMNKSRFQDDFKEEDGDTSKDNRSEDFKKMFAGNVDDCFRLGISFTRKTIKLYSDFYSSDIIIASPLGLRLIVGVDGEGKRDFDFLSSIEMCIIDQADAMLMQNMEHLTVVMDALNLLPVDAHGADFSRVRPWSLDALARHARQTMIFGSVMHAELNSLFNNKCQNIAGKVKYRTQYRGVLPKVIHQTKQVFQRMQCSDPSKADDDRFDFFKRELMPRLRQSTQTRIIVFIPSYFDYVRVRNYMKKEEESFASLCEYTRDKDISRSRSNLYHGRVQFLLLTERFHFFRRYRIRGGQNIVFYGLPVYPSFYSEVINYLEGDDEGSSHCTVLFHKFEALQLERIVGTERCRRLLYGEKSTYLFC